MGHNINLRGWRKMISSTFSNLFLIIWNTGWYYLLRSQSVKGTLLFGWSACLETRDSEYVVYAKTYKTTRDGKIAWLDQHFGPNSTSWFALKFYRCGFQRINPTDFGNPLLKLWFFPPILWRWVWPNTCETNDIPMCLITNVSMLIF